MLNKKVNPKNNIYLSFWKLTRSSGKSWKHEVGVDWKAEKIGREKGEGAYWGEFGGMG